MRATMLFTVGLLLLGQAYGQKQSALAAKVQAAKSSKSKFQAISLFDAAGDAKSNTKLKSSLKAGQMLTLKQKAVQSLYASKPDAIELDLPGTQKAAMRLELVKNNLLSDDFSVIGSQKSRVNYSKGVFYHGIVQGVSNSVVAIAVFENEVIGVLNTPTDGAISLGKTTNDANSTNYVMYKQQDLTQLPSFECLALPTPGSKPPAKIESNTKVLSKCVKAYLELDYDLVTEKGGATGAINYITGLMNAVSSLYLNEQITLQVSQIYTWTTPDSYPTTSTSAVLDAFKATRTSYNGNFAHLILRGQPANGGVAYVDALCSPYAYGMSSISSTYLSLPNYSWSVEVLTHEMGHNLGSPHTHACAWNGNNTAIDGCGPQAGANEGCTGPIPTKGTIMSYCHLLNGVGIDFNLGFGQQPGDRIRTEINNAPCLTTCTAGGGGGSGPCSQTVTLTGSTSICNAGTGTLTATANGTAPFTYTWSSGQNTQTISGLSGGTYSVTVTSSGGCTGSASRTITLSSSLSLTTVVTNETVAGAKNGAINLTVSGGTTPYTYKWTNGTATEDLANLAAGTYTVTVTSSNGCTGTKSTTVTAGTGSGGGGGGGTGSCTPLVTLPQTQGFEGSLGGGWTQGTNDGTDWTIKSGPTPSANTGPSAAAVGSYYIYTEATGFSGKTAVLETPCFNLANISNPNILFSYHMFGAAMGSLKIEVSKDAGSSWVQLWAISGNQTNAWKNTIVPLSSFKGAIVKLRITGTIGGETSDMAIDNFRVVNGTN